MKKNILLSTVFISTFLLNTPISHAQNSDPRDARIELLEEKIRLLSEEVRDIKSEPKTESPVKVTMKPTPKFTTGDFSFQPFGRIHLDYAMFDDDELDHPTGAEFRRARLGMKGQISKGIGYKIEIDFANEKSNFKDVFVNYTGLDKTEFRVGSFKTFYGMDNLTSANQMTFIERAAVTSAFTISEIIGAGVIVNDKNWSFSAGLFNDDAGQSSSDDEALYAVARATVAPINTDTVTAHLGGSFGYRKPDQATNKFDFDATAENALQSADSVSADFTDADYAYTYGLEAGLSLGPFHAQGEYFLMDVERENTSPGVSFHGGYIQAGYFLTGEHRGYKSSKGVLGGIKPNKAFDISKGDWGAWEIAARYSAIDVSDKDILGGEMDNYTIGLNWYLNDYARIMANYIMVDTDNNAVTPNDDPNILLLRTQLSF